MNARTLIAVACVAALSACAGGSFVVNERYFPSGVVFVPADRKVNVSMDGSGAEAVIVVNREPLKLNARENSNGTFEEVTVTFKLQTSGYTFVPTQMSPDPLKWVALKANPKFGDTRCVYGGSDGTDQTELNCRFTPVKRNQVNAYTLRVFDGTRYIESDPSMMN